MERGGDSDYLSIVVNGEGCSHSGRRGRKEYEKEKGAHFGRQRKKGFMYSTLKK